MDRLKMGMIGGGKGSFIGPVHRIAAAMDGMTELVAGAFSSQPEVSAETGRMLGLDPSRVYMTWEDMISKESQLPAAERIDFVAIVTPNHLHFGPAIAAAKAGFHIVCDKPLCMSAGEAKELGRIIAESGVAFCITHNYTGYPMVKKAREMVMNKEIGTVRKVVTEYLQGWLTEKQEEKGNSQAIWRADPAKAGVAGCMADIGTHAFQLSEYISGKRVSSLYSQLNSVVEGRKLDDDGVVIFNMEDDVKGVITASQVATGEENNLKIRIYGSEGSITWEQMEPNSLIVRWTDKPYQVYRTATGFNETGGTAALHARIPAGHPEGFIEAFANIYRNFAIGLSSSATASQKTDYDYPGLTTGIKGMKFLEAVVKSSASKKWVTIE